MTAEQSVLGSALIDPACVPIVCGELTSEDFTTTATIETFNAIQSLWQAGSAIDLVTIANELDSRGTMERAGGIEAITDLLTLTPTSANVRYYIDIVHESRRRRVFSSGVRKSLELAENGDDGFMDFCRATLDEAGAIGAKSVSRIGDTIPEVLNMLGDTKRGKSTGFTTLDVTTGGLQDGNLVIIGARPGIGKTAFACNIAANMCRYKMACSYHTVEMSRHEITERILLSEAMANKYKPDAPQKVGEAAERVGMWDLFIDDRGSVSVGDIISSAYKFKQSAKRLDAVFVDYLQLLRVDTKKRDRTRNEDLGAASRALKIMAKELNCPVIALSQLNRQSEGKTPTIADLRESGAIEQDADLVLLLHRTEDSPKETTLIIGKNRHGKTGDIPLVWQPEYTRFFEKAR